MTDYVINHYEKKGQFHKAEGFIAGMDLSRVMCFLERWHDKVDHDEYAIIVARMALLYTHHHSARDYRPTSTNPWSFSPTSTPTTPSSSSPNS